MRARRETLLNTGAGTGDKGGDEAGTQWGLAQPVAKKEDREGHRGGRTELQLDGEKEATKRKIEAN